MGHVVHLLLYLIPPTLLHQVFFNPGTPTTFDFFDLNPTIRTNPLYTKYCVQNNCTVAIIFNFVQTISFSTTFNVATVSQEGAYIMSVKSSDIGFTLPATVNLTASYLCMQSPEEYLSRALPVYYKRGRTVVAPCPVLAIPQPTVTWSKGVGLSDVYLNTADEGKYTITKLGHLFISNFSDSDVGRYSCTANNVCGERCSLDTDCSGMSAQSEYYELKIEDEVDTNDTTKLMRLKYYFLNPRNIDCWVPDCFSYYQAFSTISMYIEPHDDINVEVFAYMHSKSGYIGAKMHTDYQSPRFKSYSDKVCYGQLLNYTYKDVQLNAIQCGAYQAHGMLSVSVATYNIAITEPPHISFSTATSSVQYGSHFTIVFSISKGHPDSLKVPLQIIEVTCFKNGEPFLLLDGWHKKCIWDNENNKVTIKVVCATETDTGYYQVRAMNRAGSRISEPAYIETIVQADAHDVIHCFPLRHVVLSATSVRLSWNRPSTNQSNLLYEIQVQNLMWPEDIPSIHTVKLVHTVERLHPGTKYYAMVVAKGDLVGHRASFQTHQKRPTAAPTALSCNPVDQTTKLYCIWNEIPLKERNGYVEQYKVTYRCHNNWLMNMTTVEFVYLADLEPYIRYTVQVAGCNLDGCGPTQEVEQTTVEDRPSRPSIRYKIPGVNNIRVGWERPFGTFKYILYKVICKDNRSQEIVFSKDNISEVDAVISGSRVKSGTPYVVTIVPHNTQGYGPVLTEEVSTLSGVRSRLGLSWLLNFIYLWTVMFNFNVI